MTNPGFGLPVPKFIPHNSVFPIAEFIYQIVSWIKCQSEAQQDNGEGLGGGKSEGPPEFAD